MSEANPTRNFFELLVKELILGAETELRILMKRWSLGRSALAVIEEHRQLAPNHVRKFLDAETMVQDLEPYFPFAPKETDNSEKELLVIKQESGQTPNRRSNEMIVSLTYPVKIEYRWVFYGVADRGFLWGRGFLGSFSGEIEEAHDLKLENLWRS